MAKTLRYDDEKHQYFLDEKELKSVTTYISCVGVRKLPRDENGERLSFNSITGDEFFGKAGETSAKFGKAMHAYAAMRMYGTLRDAIDFNPEMTPWVDAWEAWYVEKWPRYLSKKYKEHAKWGLVVDWKTSTAVSDYWGVQIAAYAEAYYTWRMQQKLVPDVMIETPIFHPTYGYAGTPDVIANTGAMFSNVHCKKLVVRILPEGCKEIAYEGSGDWNSFLSLLNIYNRFAK